MFFNELSVVLDGVYHQHEHSLTSTQDQIDAYCGLCSASQWVLLTADFQTAGRGTHGRDWHAQVGQSLLMTLMTQSVSAEKVRYLTQIVGLSIVQVLQAQYGVIAQIKWVNDILVDGKKIAGILCEGDGHYYKIGIGLNVNMTEQACASVGQAATSLRLVTGLVQHRQAVLEQLVLRVKANVELLQHSDFATEFLPAIQTTMAYLGEEVTFVTHGKAGDKTKQITGIFTGLNSEGHIGIAGRYYASGSLLPLSHAQHKKSN